MTLERLLAQHRFDAGRLQLSIAAVTSSCLTAPAGLTAPHAARSHSSTSTGMPASMTPRPRGMTFMPNSMRLSWKRYSRRAVSG